MSKRVRGTSQRHRRPGARPPSERSARRAREARPDPISAADATPLELTPDLAEDMVEEGPEAPTPATGRTPAIGRAPATDRSPRTVHHRQRIKAGSLLATRAATEYVYVSQDIRRIAIVSLLLLTSLLVLWLLLVVLRVVELPFY